MKLTKDEIHGLGVAFNEATLLGVEVDASRNLCGITLAILALPTEGPAPPDSRLQVILHPVGRVAASLRHGRWDDEMAKVELFEIEDILPVVQSFHAAPIYGWEFFNTPEDHFIKWSNRLSLDWRGDPEAMVNNLTVFQEGFNPERILDIRIWFRDILFHRPSGEHLPIETVIVDGQRWWDGVYAGDPRTQGHGIYPLKND